MSKYGRPPSEIYNLPLGAIVLAGGRVEQTPNTIPTNHKTNPEREGSLKQLVIGIIKV